MSGFIMYFGIGFMPVKSRPKRKDDITAIAKAGILCLFKPAINMICA